MCIRDRDLNLTRDGPRHGLDLDLTRDGPRRGVGVTREHLRGHPESAQPSHGGGRVVAQRVVERDAQREPRRAARAARAGQRDVHAGDVRVAEAAVAARLAAALRSRRAARARGARAGHRARGRRRGRGPRSS